MPSSCGIAECTVDRSRVVRHVAAAEGPVESQIAAAVGAVVCHVWQNRKGFDNQHLGDWPYIVRDDFLLDRHYDRLRIA